MSLQTRGWAKIGSPSAAFAFALLFSISTASAQGLGGAVLRDPGFNFLAGTPPEILLDKSVAFLTPTDRKVRLQLFDSGGWPVSSRSNIHIRLVGVTGKSVRVTPDNSGMISFDARPGLIAVVSSGPVGHAVVPIVIREKTTAGLLPRRTDPIPIPTFQLGSTEVRRTVGKFIPPTGVTGPVAIRVNQPLVRQGEVVPSNRYRVHLDSEGQMTGQVFSLLEPGAFERFAGTNVLIHRDGQPIARGISDSSGRFVISDLEPGKYGLVMVGPSGYAAFAFEARRPRSRVVPRSRPSSQRLTDLSADASTAAPTFVNTMAANRSDETLITAIAAGEVLPVFPVPTEMFPTNALSGAGDVGDLAAGAAAGSSSFAGGGAAGAGGGAAGGGGGGMGGGMGAAAMLPAALAGIGGFDDPDDPDPQTAGGP